MTLEDIGRLLGLLAGTAGGAAAGNVAGKAIGAKVGAAVGATAGASVGAAVGTVAGAIVGAVGTWYVMKMIRYRRPAFWIQPSAPNLTVPLGRSQQFAAVLMYKAPYKPFDQSVTLDCSMTFKPPALIALDQTALVTGIPDDWARVMATGSKVGSDQMTITAMLSDGTTVVANVPVIVDESQ